MTVARARGEERAQQLVEAVRARIHPLVEWISRRSEPIEVAVGERVGALLDRPPLNSPWVRQMARRWLLPVWFFVLVFDPVVQYLTHPPLLCFDCRLYIDATRAWLAGGDPWQVTYRDVYFAAPPISLVPLVPFTLLPQPLDWQVLGIFCAVVAVLTIRILRLPWWWLLFPPVVQGVASGNVQMLLIPLILYGGGWLAGALKLYAAIPLVFLGKWRQLLGLAVVLLVTAPFLPWGLYVSEYGFINENLRTQTAYGQPLTMSLLFLVPALIAVAVIGRERGAWLFVPAVWPHQQWYYASLVLPARSYLVGAIVAIPIVGSGGVALIAFAIVEVLRRRSQERSARDPAPSPGTA